jgi:serine/threonine protein phosphatase PrpC
MPELTLRAAVESDVGLRENNEDASYASPRLLAVADGVGGAAAGEVASRLAILKMVGLDKRRLVGSLEQELADAVTDANDLIAFVTAYDARHAGMGTTLTAVALSNDGAYLIANVGDSRTYLLRDKQLCRLTRDDSLVQELIDRGALTERDARRHPQRSVVLEALDGVARPLSSVRALSAQIGDRLLLCSDGVSDYLTDEQIAELLGVPDADRAVRQLVEAALHHASRDNVTAIIADVVAGGPPDDGWLDALPVSAGPAR